MKIDYQPGISLRIVEVPWFAWIFGGCFVLVGLIVTVLMLLWQTTLICERIEPVRVNCTFTTSLAGLFATTTTVQHVEHATVEVTTRGRSSERAIVLHRGNEETRLAFDLPVSRQRLQAIADRINAFVSNQDDRVLTVEQGTTRWFPVVAVGLPAILPGLLVALIMGRVVIWTFNLLMQKLTVETYGPLGHRVRAYALSEIGHAIVEGRRPGKSSNRVVLVLKTGTRLPMTIYYDSMNQKKKREIVNSITELLGSDAGDDRFA